MCGWLFYSNPTKAFNMHFSAPHRNVLLQSCFAMLIWIGILLPIFMVNHHHQYCECIPLCTIFRCPGYCRGCIQCTSTQDPFLKLMKIDGSWVEGRKRRFGTASDCVRLRYYWRYGNGIRGLLVHPWPTHLHIKHFLLCVLDCNTPSTRLLQYTKECEAIFPINVIKSSRCRVQIFPLEQLCRDLSSSQDEWTGTEWMCIQGRVMMAVAWGQDPPG